MLSGPNVEERRVYVEGEGQFEGAEGEIVSTQTVSSKTRTVETITVSSKSKLRIVENDNLLSISYLQYKTERDGVVETRVEQKITIQSDGDPIDHDKALAEAIQEVSRFLQVLNFRDLRWTFNEEFIQKKTCH